MKYKLLLTFFLISWSVIGLAQTNNIFQDALLLKSYIDPAAGQLTLADQDKWLPVLKKYVPKSRQDNYNTIINYFKDNPFALKGTRLIQQNRDEESFTDADRTGALAAADNPNQPSFNGFSANVFSDALAQVIIKRAKEELTATFFVQFRKKLDESPELRIVFSKTAQFIDQIQPYQYAGFLNTLKQAFLEDLNVLPQHIGSFLRSDRVKAFITSRPQTQKIWVTVPVLCFLGDLNQGRSFADCVKSLYPDDELQAVAPDYYAVLKLTAVLSESVRDASGKSDWIDFNTFQTKISADPTTEQIFFGLVYTSVKTVGFERKDGTMKYLSDYIDNTKIPALSAIINEVCKGFPDVKKVYTDIQTISQANQQVTLPKILELINTATTDMKAVFSKVNSLTAKDSAKINVNTYFDVIPKITEIIKNVNERKYSSAIMNSVIVINQYVAKGKIDITPFEGLQYLDIAHVNSNNLKLTIDTAIKRLSDYAQRYNNDDVQKLVTELDKAKALLQNDQASALAKTLAVFKQALQYKQSFDSNELYADLLRYASFMAAVSEAKTTEEVGIALDAAILPPGSSSIKYYTAFSFSINSYIGGSWYKEYYSATSTTPKTSLGTLGFALPVGVNVSMSTRNKYAGAVSLFVSAIDIGAVASYRLKNPDNVKSESLPQFTWQNILAPGAFVVVGRLFNTPLSLGIGVQKGPQLRSITYQNGAASVDISDQQNFRFGAFLSFDIPLFNLYSKALKRPIND